MILCILFSDTTVSSMPKECPQFKGKSPVYANTGAMFCETIMNMYTRQPQGTPVCLGTLVFLEASLGVVWDFVKNM